jgi:hypothetical protein
MKTLVIYYSYSGHTRALAQAAAQEMNADLVEVRDVRRPGIVGAFLRCPKAMRMAATPIAPLDVDFAGYDRVVVMAPVWAGHPAPTINAVWPGLPRGASVEVRLVSSGGVSACQEKVAAKLTEQGCTLAAWQDIKA